MRNYKFQLNESNEEFMRSLLKEMGVAPEVVDALQYGYYEYDGSEIRPISKETYIMLKVVEISAVTITTAAVGAVGLAGVYNELNTEEYGCKNVAGKPTGHGYAFEDMNNRKYRSMGYTVDSSIGKTKEEGGPDARVTDKDGNTFYVQYKCISPNQVDNQAEKIRQRGGYPDQLIVVNPESAELLRRKLQQMEAEGSVPKGTADRIIESGCTREEALKVAGFFTKEGLAFDAKEVAPVAIVVFLVGGAIAFACYLSQEGEVNKRVVTKSLTVAAVLAGVCLVGGVIFNQFRRLRFR